MPSKDDYKEEIVEYIERKSDKMRQAMRHMIDDEVDDEYEVIEVTRGWWNRTVRDLSKASVGKQLAVGGATGWCSGYLFGKVGKAAALALGGSLLIVQVAHHQGYITINYGRMEKSWKAYQRKIQRKTERTLPIVIDEVQDFIADNAVLAGGFCAGFLLGLVT